MFGKNTGASLQIAAEQPKALSTYCQGHSLNLGIKITMTNSNQMKDVGNIKDLIQFESLHTDNEIEVALTLDKLSATRWTVHGKAYKKKESDYLSLMKLWDVSLATGKLGSEVKARIIRVQNQICQFQFLYDLN